MSGDTVNMHGGTHNIGIQHQHSGGAQPAPPDLLEAIAELSHLLQELRNQGVTPATAQVIDNSLPVISSQASPPEERRGALIAVASIAQSVGALGTTIVDAVDRVLGLLGQ
ncbi:hypothetical protein [Streptomyces sp. NPDC059909]|uniref:hypothetical protein n=1 Tax=Streptomyces sp. NPDC059909 TaxID=3346998 RepID=UPI0036604208